MTKSFKKGLAVVLAAAMVFSTPIAANTVVASAEEAAAEELKNPTVSENVISAGAWWAGQAGHASSDYYLKKEGNVDIYFSSLDTFGTMVMEAHAVGDSEYQNVYITSNINGGLEVWGSGFGVEPGTTFGTSDNDWGGIKGDRQVTGTFKLALSWSADDKIKAELVDYTEDKNGVTLGSIEQPIVSEDVKTAGALAFYMYPQYGRYIVGPTLQSVSDLISDIKVDLAEGKIQVTAKKVGAYDSIELKVNDQVVADQENIAVDEATGVISYAYTPAESGEYKFDLVAKKGDSPDTETATLKVDVTDGKVTADVEMIANLKAAKGADAISITYDKLIEDAAYAVKVEGGGKEVAVGDDGSIKFTALTDGVEYTVTVTATKEGYKDKTATTKFTYTAEKQDAAGADVKRTQINKTVGTTDCNQAFWSAFSDGFKIEDNKKYTLVFENHGDGKQNYNNFVMVFANQADCNNDTRGDKYEEYAVVRADNYSWIVKDGATVENTTLDGKAVTYTNSITDGAASDQIDAKWAEWLSIIKDSDVTMDIVRSGSNVKVSATIVSQADKSKKIDWTASLSAGKADGSAPDPLYMILTVDHCYLNMKYIDEQVSTEKLQDQQVSTEKPKTQPKTMNLMSTSAKVGAKKVTGSASVSLTGAKITVTVNKKAAKSVKISGKNFTATLSKKLKAGDKVAIKITKDGYTSVEKTVTVKAKFKLTKVKAKKGTKKVTGKLNTKKATVKVKVGKKKYKKAKVSGKSFTFKCAKLKKGTKVKIRVSKKNYTTLTKTVKVK